MHLIKYDLLMMANDCLRLVIKKFFENNYDAITVKMEVNRKILIELKTIITMKSYYEFIVKNVAVFMFKIGYQFLIR